MDKSKMLEVMELAMRSIGPDMRRADGHPTEEAHTLRREASRIMREALPGEAAEDVMVDRWGTIYVAHLSATPLARGGWQLAYGGQPRMTADDAAALFCAQIMRRKVRKATASGGAPSSIADGMVAALERIASGRDCILSIICATKHEARLIAATAMWTAAVLPGAHERTFALTEEGEGWRVAVALHTGPGGMERLEYEDVDGLIDYLNQE